MADSPKKIRVVKDGPVPKEELEKAKSFSKLKTRYDEARKPLYKRNLFQYRQRWFFVAIVIIVIIILLILKVL